MLLARAACHFGTITPALLHILAIVEEYARFHNLTVIAVSGSDGRNGPDGGASAHERGEAVDLRVRFAIPADKRVFLDTILARLGPSFTGYLAHEDQPNEHYHFQLRRGAPFSTAAIASPHVARFVPPIR